MIVRKIVPDGWPCLLSECRPGMFVDPTMPDLICFKSEYTTNGKPDVYNSGGECWCGGENKIIQPVKLISEEE